MPGLSWTPGVDVLMATAPSHHGAGVRLDEGPRRRHLEPRDREGKRQAYRPEEEFMQMPRNSLQDGFILFIFLC